MSVRTDTSGSSAIDRAAHHPETSTVITRQGTSDANGTGRFSFGSFIGVASIVGGFLLWEIVARAEIINPLFLPRLSDVISQLWSTASSGDLNRHAWASGQALLAGLALSIIIGVPAGLALGRVQILDRIFGPWLIAVNSVPRIAFIPMLIVIFGLGLTSKVAVVFMTSAFPLIINTAAGAKAIDPLLLQMSQSFQVSRFVNFRRIIVPGSVPFMLAGFRVSVAQALIGVVVAELFASNAGIGYLLFRAGNLYDIPMVYAMMLVLGGTGVALGQGARWLEHRFESWRT